MKTGRIIISLILCAVMLFGCSSGVETDDQQKKTGGKDSPIEIGVTFDSFVIERWERDRDIFVTTAKDMGAEVNVQNANGDVNRQKDQIRYFTEKGVDVIVIVAVDSNAITSEVREAKAKNIPVIAYDRLIRNAGADLYISFDNEMVGHYMAKALLTTLSGKGRILKINGPAKDNNVSLVNKGFDDTMAGRNIIVEDEYYASEWNGEEAFKYLEEHQTLADSVDGVMCGNDTLAGQAVRYYSVKRKAGQVAVVGQDADLDACQRVVEGTQTMTVYKPIEKLAKKAAECAVKLASGEKPDTEDTIEDGRYSVPYVKIDPVAVTKDNMDEVIIDSGFHLKEDVYLMRQ
ncbi:MAG: substrate-binding domain-containing protein [Lachnospiraceae bacterium]|nr:substrate-binding domain-containing protein [Lachnospiraceae bacterium]